MRNIVLFIFFIVCTISLFFINSLSLLFLILLLSIIIEIILKIDIKKAIDNLKVLLPFIIFAAIINFLIDGMYSGIIIGIRLIICYNITYIFSNFFTVLEIAKTIEKICYPLKIFKINTKNIGMIVSISICMIPVLKNEMAMILRAMKSRGKKLHLNSIGVIMKPVFISILKRASQIEKTLIAKAYMEE